MNYFIRRLTFKFFITYLIYILRVEFKSISGFLSIFRNCAYLIMQLISRKWKIMFFLFVFITGWCKNFIRSVRASRLNIIYLTGVLLLNKNGFQFDFVGLSLCVI